jgi:hypothetical protein
MAIILLNFIATPMNILFSRFQLSKILYNPQLEFIWMIMPTIILINTTLFYWVMIFDFNNIESLSYLALFAINHSPFDIKNIKRSMHIYTKQEAEGFAIITKYIIQYHNVTISDKMIYFILLDEWEFFMKSNFKFDSYVLRLQANYFLANESYIRIYSKSTKDKDLSAIKYLKQKDIQRKVSYYYKNSCPIMNFYIFTYARDIFQVKYAPTPVPIPSQRQLSL